MKKHDHQRRPWQDFLLVWFFGFLAATSLLSSSLSRAQSQIYISVGEASVRKSLLAMPSFLYLSSSATKSNLKLGEELFKTINNNLTVSGFFTFIKPAAYLEDPAKTSLKPAPGDPNGFNFKNWKTIGTEFLVRGGYKVSGSKVSFDVFLYHVPQAKLVLGKTYEGQKASVRKIAHAFSNDLVKALTGKQGMFNTKVVASRTGNPPRAKEIFVMDWDGANAKKITNHKSIAISPAWSSDGTQVAYTAFAYHPKAKTRNADLFLYKRDTGRRFLISYRKGINSGAAFFPGENKMLLTISQGGTPDIFEMTPDGKKLKRITRGPGKSMNVEPAISPDGKKIAFSSDRSGLPMIYVMNRDGSGLKRITFAGKYNASPSWSPDGKKIAFAGDDKGHFDIFIINADGTGLKRLTKAKKANGRWSDNEAPTFSPDGRHIMFTSNRSGTNQLYVVSPDGTNERRITFDRNNYEKPKWSPFL